MEKLLYVHFILHICHHMCACLSFALTRYPIELPNWRLQVETLRRIKFKLLGASQCRQPHLDSLPLAPNARGLSMCGGTSGEIMGWFMRYENPN